MDYLKLFNEQFNKFLIEHKIEIFEIKQSSDRQNNNYLKIYLFKKSGNIEVNECMLFHKMANKLFQNSNIFDKVFVEDVASAGINTTINNDHQLALILNLNISCKLIVAIDNYYVIDGKFLRFDEKFIYLENKLNPEIQINRSIIKEIKIDK